MVKAKPKDDGTPKKLRPALSHEARENQLIALAEDQAEYLLRNKKAPTPVVVHYLKLGTEKMLLEKEKLKSENLLLQAKTDQVKAARESEQTYKQVLEAIKTYSGLSDCDMEEEEEYEE